MDITSDRPKVYHIKWTMNKLGGEQTQRGNQHYRNGIIGYDCSEDAFMGGGGPWF